MDEKRIHAQSTILYKTPTPRVGVNHNRVFRADTLYLRVENTVGARNAQALSSHATVVNTPCKSRYFNACTMLFAAVASSIRSMPAIGSV